MSEWWLLRVINCRNRLCKPINRKDESRPKSLLQNGQGETGSLQSIGRSDSMAPIRPSPAIIFDHKMIYRMENHMQINRLP